MVFGVQSDTLFVDGLGSDTVAMAPEEGSEQPVTAAIANAQVIPVVSAAIAAPIVAARPADTAASASVVTYLPGPWVPTSDARNLSAEHSVVNTKARTVTPFVSEWLEVPADLLEHVRSLPQPLQPYDNSYLWSRPLLRNAPLNEGHVLTMSASIVKRPLLMAVPAAGSDHEIRLAKVDPGSTNIVARQLLPILPNRLALTPSEVVLAASKQISIPTVIGKRDQLPLYTLPAVTRKPKQLTSPIGSTAPLEALSVIASRPVQPVLPRSLSSTSVLDTPTYAGTVIAANAISMRPLLPIVQDLPRRRPVLAHPGLLDSATVLAAPPVATRSASPLIPVAFNRSLESTSVSFTSTDIARRKLAPIIPLLTVVTPGQEFAFAGTLGMETMSRPQQKTLPVSFVGGTLTSVIAVASPVAPANDRPLQPLTALPAIPKPSTVVGDLTAANFRQGPVLINGLSAFSSNMLGPLSYVPRPSDLASDAPAVKTVGPSNISSDAATMEKAPIPFLVTAQPGFSSEMLRPMSSRPVFPPNPDSVISGSPVAVDGNYCDPNYVGPPIRFSQTAELRLEDLLNQLNSRFGVNFVVGPGIGQLPLNVKAGSIPWNILLRSQLYVSGVRAQCIDANTIELVAGDKAAQLAQSEPIVGRYIKLRYLQPSSKANQNIAGQSTGGSSNSSSGGGGGSSTGETESCRQGGNGGGGGGGGSDKDQSLPQRCRFERLYYGIEKILGLGTSQTQTTHVEGVDNGQTFATTEHVYRQQMVTQVPGRNMFYVRGTQSQIDDIEALIKRADVPPFQVIIKGLVYTANEDKLLDIGVQTTIVDTGKGKSTGSLLGHTLGSPLGTLFDFSTLIGTVDFNVQASALQRNGAISIKSRPFTTVLDGNTADLTVGRQIPVVIEGTTIGGVNANAGTVEILQAANLLSITPHVIDDDQGNPTAVSLELQLESNDVDQTVQTQGGVPAISVKSIQTNIILNQEQTAILGGFTVDSDNKSISKTPGLGDIPLFGELFKRRIRSTQIQRLYFAVSVTVIPYGGNIEPVTVPGATTAPPSLTRELDKRQREAEPKSIVPPKDDH